MNLKKKKKTKMKELNNWEHHGTLESVDDPILQHACPDMITFAFSNLEKGELKVAAPSK